MITNVVLPTAEALKPLVDEALQNGKLSAEEFVKNHCAGLAKAIKANPAYYRAYGAYWWSVKIIMNKQGYGALVGPEEEPATQEHFYIADDVTTLCAAWYYHKTMMDDGKLNSLTHTYGYNEDGEPTQLEYSISDDFMEAKTLKLS